MHFCVVICIVCFVTYSVLFVCICVLNYCHRVAAQLQLNISYHFPEDGGNMLLRNPGTYTRKHTAQHHHRCKTLRSDLYAHFRRTCLPNASHGLTSWIPLKQNISKARNYDEPSPFTTQDGKKYIYTLTNCSVRRPSAPVFGRRRGTEIGIKQSLKRTLVEILQHMIFRPKYYLKVQSTSSYIGAPTLRPFPSEKCTNLFSVSFNP